MDQINSKQKKVKIIDFLDPKGQLTLWSKLAIFQSHPSSHTCIYMSLLPASMNRIQSRTVEKKLQHSFSHYKSMRIFSDAQGQLTPMVGSSQISNSFKLSCMSLLPASMEKNG